MATPFVLFWILIFIGRRDLGCGWTLKLIVLWAGLLAGLMYLDLSPYFFVAVQTVIDVVLILYIFGGDIRIR